MLGKSCVICAGMVSNVLKCFTDLKLLNSIARGEREILLFVASDFSKCVIVYGAEHFILCQGSTLNFQRFKGTMQCLGDHAVFRMLRIFQNVVYRKKHLLEIHKIAIVSNLDLI